MISRSATFVVGLSVLAAVMVAFLVARERRQPQPFELAPIALPFGPPSSGFLESKVADLVSSATVVASATPSSVIDPGIATAPRQVGNADVSRKPSDRLFLELQASRLAYVRYGKIGDTPVATFYDPLKKEQLTKPEGAMVYGIRVASVTNNHVMLSYGEASPIRKPRVDLDVEPGPDSVLTPEQREALRVRFEELWGNRAKIPPEEEAGASVIPPYISPGLPVEGDPRQRYLDIFGPFLEKLQAGDPDVDPQNDPLAPTVEELLRMRQQSTAAVAGATSDRPVEGRPSP
jgi:hypothetical protein